MNTLLSIAIAVIIGLMMTRVAKPLGLPAVTAYLVTGVLIGPYCLGQLGIEGIGFTSMEAVEGLKLITQVALGFIAFSIGNEFRLSSLKKTGYEDLWSVIEQIISDEEDEETVEMQAEETPQE